MYVYHLLDKFWVPRSLKGLIRYYGIGSSEAQFNYDKNIWNLKVIGKLENTSGFSENSMAGLLLGKSNWQILQDNKGI